MNKVALPLGVVLIVVAALLGYALYEQDALLSPDKYAAHILQLLGLVCSAIAGLYVLTFNRALVLYRGEIERINNLAKAAAEATAKLIIEPEIKKLQNESHRIQKHSELVLAEDFERRKRREEVLRPFSDAVYATTKAFHSLTKAQASPGNIPNEQLVKNLADAITARESYISTREACYGRRIINDKHSETIASYSELLINIIIDVRRDSTPEHEQRMREYLAELNRLDREMDRILNLFLAPQERPGHSH